MSKKLLFIYNPHSGKGSIKEYLPQVLDIFVKAGFCVGVHPTQGEEDATKKVIESAKEFDRVVCSGGDGTLNEVITGVMQSEDDIVVGYIPSGSTNDFGSTLKLTGNISNAARIAAGENIEKIDVGCFNDKNFVYVAAFGIFTEISYETDQNLKNFFGHAAYIISAIKSLQDIPSISLQVEADGRIIHGEFIYGMVTNAAQVAGLKDFIKGDVKLNDGLFEVMLIRTPKNPIELTEIGSFFTNIIKETDLVLSFRAREIKFTGQSGVYWTLDGEFGGEYETSYITNKKQAVSMTVPKNVVLEEAITAKM